MFNIPVIVLTNDNHLWCLRPFFYCFRQFWGQGQIVDVYGFSPPRQKYPEMHFHSLDTYNYPREKWTNGLIQMLQILEADWFILMLEDFWLIEPVDLECIGAMIDYVSTIGRGKKILRIDLTADRSSRRQARPFDKYHGFQIIQTPPKTPYQMSYQAALWNADALLDVLMPNESAWQSEVDGSRRIARRDDILILGTEHHPLKYIPGYRSQQRRLHHMEKMPEPHRQRVLGMIPAHALQ